MEVTTPYRTINEVATILGVSRRTVYNWIAQDKLKYVRVPSGKIRVDIRSCYTEGNVVPVLAQE